MLGGWGWIGDGEAGGLSGTSPRGGGLSGTSPRGQPSQGAEKCTGPGWVLQAPGEVKEEDLADLGDWKAVAS